MIIIITISISATLIIMTIIITEMMTCNEVETKAGRCSPQELTGVHAAEPRCTLGRLLVNIDMLVLVMRMMSIVMIMFLLVMMADDAYYCGDDTVDSGDEADGVRTEYLRNENL